MILAGFVFHMSKIAIEDQISKTNHDELICDDSLYILNTLVYLTVIVIMLI